MVIEDLLYLLDYKQLGFPVVSFLIMVVLVIYIMGKDEKRQNKSDQRYEDLVKQFFQITRDISDKNNSALMEIIAELKNVTQNTERNIEKTKEIEEMVENVREKVEDVKEKVITNKGMAYVFREGKINRIKDDQEIDVTREIVQMNDHIFRYQ